MGRRRGVVLGLILLVVAGCGGNSKPAQESTSEAARPALSRHPITEYEVKTLTDEGLAHPVRDVVTSLMATPSVIPHEGVLGGQMGFWSADDIYVLDAHTVFARFNDGHISGSGIFEFTIMPDSTISWRAVSSRLGEYE